METFGGFQAEYDDLEAGFLVPLAERSWLIDDRYSRKFRGCPTARARRLNAELRHQISEDHLNNMKRGLARWVEAGERGYLAWGIFSFRKLSRS